MDGVRSEKQASQQAPQASSEQQTCQRGEQDGHSPVEGCIHQVVTQGLQASHSIVETEGEGAQRPKRLVTAAVREQRPPEVIVEDICPRSLWEKVLIGFDCTTVKKQINSTLEN